ncbi:MAG: hypothetical protein IT204_13055 [Fimbriimonadaceae bacterium]|nr:hypothetical protein [Fimbriimonadaceae bacterium]
MSYLDEASGEMLRYRPTNGTLATVGRRGRDERRPPTAEAADLALLLTAQPTTRETCDAAI